MKKTSCIILSLMLICMLVMSSCKGKKTCKQHSFGEYEIINEATCTNKGTKERTCSVCGFKEEELMDELGHEFKDYQIEKLPTCTTNGEEVANCTRCEEKDTKTIQPTGHDYLDATYLAPKTCKVCGETDGEKLQAEIENAFTGELTIQEGKKGNFLIEFSDKQEYDLVIEDETILSVFNLSGKICVLNALKMGSTNVVATTKDGSKTSTVTITVTEKVYNIKYLTTNREVVLPNDLPTTYKSSDLPLKLGSATRTGFAFLGYATPEALFELNKAKTLDDFDKSLLFEEIPVGTTGDLELTALLGYTRLELNIDQTIMDLNEKNAIVEVIKKYVVGDMAKAKVLFESSDDKIFTIDESGKITPVSTGFAKVTVKLEGYSNINITAGITIVDDLAGIDELIELFIKANREETIARNITVTGYQFIYSTRLLGSVSDYLFAPHVVNEEYIVAKGADNRPGDIYEKHYVCVHDTASSADTADALAHAKYVTRGGGGTSWHYSSGDTGIYHQIPDNERAYHAGDGKQIYKLTNTGISAKPNAKKIVTISADGYFEIDGEKTPVKAPLKNGSEIATTKDINDVGIRVVVKDGFYHIGDTWWSDGYKKISNTGGNCNSIGIESMVNKGSDLYLTWQKTAKLVAHLLNDNNLCVDDVKPHHFFSGKNCPQTMRDNGLWENFLQLVETEYEVLTKYSDYEIKFKSLDAKHLNSYGRVIKQEKNDCYVSYIITISKDGVSKSVTLTSKIPGMSRLYMG